MAGIGLGPEWTCTFANDFDEVKASAYKAYHGGGACLRILRGGGMARAGLGPDWTCLFANDFDFKKAPPASTEGSGAEACQIAGADTLGLG